jgi:hypothetical protein
MTPQALIAKFWPQVSQSIGESQRILFENAIEEAHHQGWMTGWADRSKADGPEATLPPNTVKDIHPANDPINVAEAIMSAKAQGL